MGEKILNGKKERVHGEGNEEGGREITNGLGINEELHESLFPITQLSLTHTETPYVTKINAN